MDHFCGIYGVGAVCIIVSSQYFNKNNFTLFLGGFIVGAVVEYLISFLVEALLNIKWWDYSGNILNISGRVCLVYSMFWGLLTVFLVKKFNPLIDRIFDAISSKVSKKVLKGITLSIIIFLAIDCLLTCYAEEKFITRMIVENNIEMEDQEKYEKDYAKTYENPFLANLINTFWNDKKMIRTFPNIKIEDKYNNTIYIGGLLPDIQTYYLKIFDKNN